MEIIINKMMGKLLVKLEKYKSPKKNINIELNKLFNEIYPDIRLYNDDIIIRENKNIEKDIKFDIEYLIKTYGDISGFENFCNHIHITDVIDCSIMQTLKFGIILKDILKIKLKQDFPKEHFIIILSCDGKDKFNTTLRFHKYRNGEVIYDPKTLDNFCEGILIEEI
jgi:hypothetical protein